MKTIEDARAFIAATPAVTQHETLVLWLMNLEERLTRQEAPAAANPTPAPEPAKT